jgi:carbohydrate-selective porin OprB
MLSWDAAKLLPTPGLSVNVGAARSTGRDLSADDVGNVFSVPSAYTAPTGGTNNITLGPMYVQQIALDGSLVLAIGAIYGRFRRHLPGASAETVIEANYQIAAIPGLVITPTAQYVIRPAGLRSIDDALVLGVQATLSF